MSVSVPTGVKDTTSRLEHQIKACPDQTFAIVGYSQGAAVMHSAAAKFGPEVLSKVVAAVMFGDPSFRRAASATGGFPTSIQTRLMENCNPGDPVGLQ
jgi:cutinase